MMYMSQPNPTARDGTAASYVLVLEKPSTARSTKYEVVSGAFVCRWDASQARYLNILDNYAH